MRASFYTPFLFALALGASVQTAGAATVIWTDWTNPNPPAVTGSSGGSTTGTIAGGVTVSYSGELQSISTAPLWTPTTTWSNANFTNAPPQFFGAIQLFGGGTVVDTVTFSTALVNPVFAIWSLGQGGDTAAFSFINPSNPIFIVGGPNIPYGGGAIQVAGNVVSGQEANGLIQFQGTVSSISWTNPNFENWYGFTVGEVSAVPELGTWAMLLLGFAGIGYMAYRRRGSTVRFA